MLKTHRDGRIFCVTQPDHGTLAGYLAAHWGNEEFARPGDMASAPDPESLRAEVVFGVAQHDNGWWEWEATPDLSDLDGLPLDLFDVLQVQQEGISRWRRGMPRFEETHPYGSLLTSCHAYWLYAPRCRDKTDPAFIHPLYGKGIPPRFAGPQHEAAEGFLAEIEERQDVWKRRLQADPATAAWVAPEHLLPHARLLQLLDGLSLSLCSGLIPPRDGETQGPGRNAFTLHDVPRRDWDDRVSVEVDPLNDKRILVAPYPFDVDPLPISVPVRVFDEGAAQGSFAVSWHAASPSLLAFEYGSR